MLKRLIQETALLSYRAVNSSGLLSTSLGRQIFEKFYLIYKRRIEAVNIGLLHDFVSPSSLVIDVGANIGFFTMYFGKWVSAGGGVLAIEAERMNYERLCVNISGARLVDVVECVHAAAADTDGTLMLAVNESNPADHWVAAEGIPVPAKKIDSLMEERGWPFVSFIKIDVQGGEWAVLEGAITTIRKFRPAIYMEIDDRALARTGHNATVLIERLAVLGYEMFGIERGHIQGPLSREVATNMRSSLGYADFLFLARTNLSPQVETNL